MSLYLRVLLLILKSNIILSTTANVKSNVLVYYPTKYDNNIICNIII